MKRAKLVNTLDKQRILSSIDVSGQPPDHVRQLLSRIEESREVRPALVPPDLVTMNSVVRVCDAETGVEDVYALVYPDAPPRTLPSGEAEWVTFQCRLGSAVFGRWVGEEIEFRGPRRTERLVIKGLEYQPEAAGDLER